MKFLALIAIVAAQDEEEAAAEPLESGADCSAEGAMCGEGLCCGTATAAAEPEEQGGDDEEAAGDGIVVCNDETADTFANDDGDFAFACNVDGASRLAMGAALLSAYLLA